MIEESKNQKMKQSVLNSKIKRNRNSENFAVEDPTNLIINFSVNNNIGTNTLFSRTYNSKMQSPNPKNLKTESRIKNRIKTAKSRAVAFKNL